MSGPSLKNSPHPPYWLSWTVWGLGAVLYVSGFYQRVAPAVMTSELMADFNIGAAALGNLSGFYFYSYLAVQIPTGILADTWGPRRLLSLGALIAGLGTILFGLTDDYIAACIGRFLIGGSVGVAFVAMIRLAVNWFPPQRLSLVTGLALFFGSSGAVAAGVPLRLLVENFGWRPVMLVSGAITLAACLAIWIFVRNDPTQRGYKSYSSTIRRGVGISPRISVIKGLIEVVKSRNVTLLFLAPSGLAGPVLTFSGLWGVPYLKARFALDQTGAAGICSLMMICWAVGGPVMGALSDRIGARKPIYLICCLAAAVGWGALFYWPGLPLAVFTALVVVVGLSTGGIIVGFAFAKESVPDHLAGTSAGVINMGVMLGPTVLQPIVGWVLDMYWAGGLEAGARVYEPTTFQIAFGLLVGWTTLSCLLVAFTKETYCMPFEDASK